MWTEPFRCMAGILIAFLGTHCAFSDDWQVAKEILINAAYCSNTMPNADLAIELKISAALKKDRFADRAIQYRVITDWKRAFVKWQETRPNDREMPSDYFEWSFDGTVKKHNPFSPGSNHVATEMHIAGDLTARNGWDNGRGMRIDPRGIGVLPSSYTQHSNQGGIRMEEFLIDKENFYECRIPSQIPPDQEISIEMRTKHPSEIDRKWIRRYLFQLTEEPRRITKAQLQQFNAWGTWTNPIQENSAISVYPDVSHANMTIPESMVYTETKNGVVVNREEWNITFAPASHEVVTSALAWNNFSLKPGRIVNVAGTDRIPVVMQWDGSKLIAATFPASPALVSQDSDRLLRLWPVANVIVALAAAGYVIYRKYRLSPQESNGP